MKTIWPAICTLLTVATCAPAGADTVYRWTDSQGTVVFSDRPPAGADHSVALLDIVNAPGPSAPEVAERRAAMEQLSEQWRSEWREAERANSAPAQAAPIVLVQPQPAYSRTVYWPSHGHRAGTRAPLEAETAGLRQRLPRPNWPGPARRWMVEIAD